MLTRIDVRGSRVDLHAALRRANPSSEPIADAVLDIIQAVRARGDAALTELTKRFDGCKIETFLVPADEVEQSLEECDPHLRMALEFSRDQILAWHEAQREREAKHERGGV